MRPGLVQIDELVLRIPGLSTDEGRLLGEEVTRRVADGLPVGERSREIGGLDLTVRIPTGASRNKLALLIAEAILKGLV